MRSPGERDVVIAHTLTHARAWLNGIGVDPRGVELLTPGRDGVRGRMFTYDDVQHTRVIGPVWMAPGAQQWWTAMLACWRGVEFGDLLSRPWHDARVNDLHEIFHTHVRLQHALGSLKAIDERCKGPSGDRVADVRGLVAAALRSDRQIVSTRP